MKISIPWLGLLSVLLSGCGVGLRVFDAYLTTTLPATFTTGYCYEIALNSADRNNADSPVAEESNIDITLRTDGWLRFHANQSDCELNLRPITALTIPVGSTSVGVWAKAYVPQTQAVTFTATAVGYGELAYSGTAQGTPFDITEGFNGSLYRIRATSDGKVYVAGSPNRHGATVIPGMARMDADGNLDTSFTTSFTVSSSSTIFEVLEVGDGSGDLLIGGSFTTINGTTAGRIGRINADGTLDASFLAGMGTGFDNQVRAIEPVGDGSGDCYVGGSFTTYNGTAAARIARLNADGSLETAFVIGAGFDSTVTVMAVATDGSHDLYAGGDFTTYKAASSPYIIRVDPNGNAVGTFVVGTGFNSSVRALAIPPDGTGDIYIGGLFTTYKAVASAGFARLTATGSAAGSFTIGTGFNNAVRGIGATATTVYAAGDFTTFKGTALNRIARLTSAGAVDTTFALGTGIDASVQTLLVTSDARVHVAGDMLVYNDQARNRYATILSTGEASPGQKGGAMFNNAVVAVSTGEVYVGGQFTRFNGKAQNYLARLKTNGTLDTSFNVGSGADGIALGVWAESNGAVFASGFFSSINGVSTGGFTRLKPDGTKDSGFSCSTDGNVFSLLPQVDTAGDLYIGGTFSLVNGTARARLARLNADGSVDTQFNGTGAAGGSVNAFAASPNGDLYVGGNFTSFNGIPSNRIARANSDGSTDAAFAVGTGFDNVVNSIALADDGTGDIYCGGNFTTYDGVPAPRLIRLKSDGSVASSFVPGAGPNAAVYGLVATNDGSGGIYVAGGFTTYNGTQALRITKLLADGTFDSNFYSLKGLNGDITALVRVPGVTGKLLVGGSFTQFRLISADRIARIDPVWGFADDTP